MQKPSSRSVPDMCNRSKEDGGWTEEQKVRSGRCRHGANPLRPQVFLETLIYILAESGSHWKVRAEQ